MLPCGAAGIEFIRGLGFGAAVAPPTTLRSRNRSPTGQPDQSDFEEMLRDDEDFTQGMMRDLAEINE